MKSRREQVRESLERGLTVRETALLLNMTTQTAYYHLAALRRAGFEWPKENGRRSP